MGFRSRSHRDKNHKAIQDALERAGCHVADLSGAGKGISDLLAYRVSTGLLRLLEIKNPDSIAKVHRKANRKKSATELAQEKFATRFPVWKVTSIAEALAAMEVELAS